MKSLIPETIQLVKEENSIGARIIVNLKVHYKDKDHLATGYESFHKFCVEKLKMSGANTSRKIDAMKLSFIVKDLPEKIDAGEINLTQVGEVAKFVRHETKDAGGTFKKKEIVRLIERVSKEKNEYEVKKLLARESHVPVPRKPDQVKVLPGGTTRLEFEVDDEFLDLLEQVRMLHSHKGKRPTMELLKDVLKEHLVKNHPAHRGQKKSQVVVQEAFFAVPAGTKKPLPKSPLPLPGRSITKKPKQQPPH